MQRGQMGLWDGTHPAPDVDRTAYMSVGAVPHAIEAARGEKRSPATDPFFTDVRTLLTFNAVLERGQRSLSMAYSLGLLAFYCLMIAQSAGAGVAYLYPWHRAGENLPCPLDNEPNKTPLAAFDPMYETAA